MSEGEATVYGESDGQLWDEVINLPETVTKVKTTIAIHLMAIGMEIK